MPETPQEILKTVSDYVLSKSLSKPLLVAINGKDASGKTIFAKNLVYYLRKRTTQQIIYIAFDKFLNKSSIRNAKFKSEAIGSFNNAFNYQGFIDTFLAPLTSSSIYKDQIYDLEKDTEVESSYKHADINSIFIVDGLFLYRKELLNYWDIKVLLEADTDVIIERGAKRDESVFGSYALAKDRYLNRYMPSQEVYYNETSPKKISDIIIKNSDPTNATILIQKF